MRHEIQIETSRGHAYLGIVPLSVALIRKTYDGTSSRSRRCCVVSHPERPSMRKTNDAHASVPFLFGGQRSCSEYVMESVVSLSAAETFSTNAFSAVSSPMSAPYCSLEKTGLIAGGVSE